jgi:adenylate cyclase
MALEIERKFLVCGEFRNEATKAIHIVQGYLAAFPERTVRVRIMGDRGYVTVKGEARHRGLGRYEWEKEIPVTEAEELLLLCEPSLIEKTRYIIETGKHFFEVDDFHGDNAGLIIAEIELSSEDEDFVRPSWLGEEVTDDQRYYNAALSKNPYKNW